MSLLTVRHVTVYRYSQPVELGAHRMMFRPRESHDLKLIKTGLSISPQPVRLRWLHDVFDNSIAIAEFEVQPWNFASKAPLPSSTSKFPCRNIRWKSTQISTLSGIRTMTCLT